MNNLNALYSATASLTPSHLIGRKAPDGKAFHWTSRGYEARDIAEVGTKTMRLARPDFLPSSPRV